MGRLAVWTCVAFAAGSCGTDRSASRTDVAPDGSAPPPGAVSASEASDRRAESREIVVAAARAMVGKPRVVVGHKRYPNDCTGLVRAAFDQVGVDLFSKAKRGDNGVTAIFRFAEAHGRIYIGGRPVAGDLVFFHDTYGRRSHHLTHVGLVDKVEDDKTVWIIHRVSRGVVRYRMNLEQPDLRFDKSGRIVNDYLRLSKPGRHDVLTSQLFAAYATILPVDAGPSKNASLRDCGRPPWATAARFRDEESRAACLYASGAVPRGALLVP